MCKSHLNHCLFIWDRYGPLCGTVLHTALGMGVSFCGILVTLLPLPPMRALPNHTSSTLVVTQYEQTAVVWRDFVHLVYSFSSALSNCNKLQHKKQVSSQLQCMQTRVFMCRNINSAFPTWYCQLCSCLFLAGTVCGKSQRLLVNSWMGGCHWFTDGPYQDNL